jgi:hypothetical protein
MDRKWREDGYSWAMSDIGPEISVNNLVQALAGILGVTPFGLGVLLGITFGPIILRVDVDESGCRCGVLFLFGVTFTVDPSRLHFVTTLEFELIVRPSNPVQVRVGFDFWNENEGDEEN